MRSAIYEGVVRHRRTTPVDHEFSYRLYLPLIDLSEAAAVMSRHPWWSIERRRPVRFRRDDYLGPVDVPLDTAVRDAVEGQLGWRPNGDIAVLAHPRTWGWLFNPIALYFCYDVTGERIEALAVEVTNTPWHERHVYVMGAPGTHRLVKAMHVSPFMGMDAFYEFDYAMPGDDLVVSIDVYEGGALVLATSLRLSRHEMDRRTMGRVLWNYPLVTWRVTLGIYRQALALWRRGVPFLAHPPKNRDLEGARGRGASNRDDEAKEVHDA